MTTEVQTEPAVKRSARARVADTRERRRAAGLVRLEVFVHPDDRDAVKAHAAELQARREKR